MVNGLNSSIVYRDLFESFRNFKPSPSKCDRSLNRDMRLKQQQLKKTMRVLNNSYPDKTLSLVSKNLPQHTSITQITSEIAYLKSSYKFVNYRNRKILKKGEMIQIDGTNIVFFTYLDKKVLVSLSVYKTSNKICLRMEGTHRKKIFSSNYIEKEDVEQIDLNNTLVKDEYILFQFKNYCSLYRLDLDNCHLLVKFRSCGLFNDIKLLNSGQLCLIGT
jgi:hypothetical protein